MRLTVIVTLSPIGLAVQVRQETLVLFLPVGTLILRLLVLLLVLRGSRAEDTLHAWWIILQVWHTRDVIEVVVKFLIVLLLEYIMWLIPPLNFEHPIQLNGLLELLLLIVLDAAVLIPEVILRRPLRLAIERRLVIVRRLYIELTLLLRLQELCMHLILDVCIVRWIQTQVSATIVSSGLLLLGVRHAETISLKVLILLLDAKHWTIPALILTLPVHR
jgi:hypothetical protein